VNIVRAGVFHSARSYVRLPFGRNVTARNNEHCRMYELRRPVTRALRPFAPEFGRRRPAPVVTRVRIKPDRSYILVRTIVLRRVNYAETSIGRRVVCVPVINDYHEKTVFIDLARQRRHYSRY